jgi:hypothetical protein
MLIRYKIEVAQHTSRFVPYGEAEVQRRIDALMEAPYGFYDQSDAEYVIESAAMATDTASAPERGGSIPLWVYLATAEDGAIHGVAYESPITFEEDGTLRCSGHRWQDGALDQEVSETWRFASIVETS